MHNNGPVTVVNIVSASYSGSTWVNLLLGSHSQAFSVGEVDRLVRRPGTTCSLHGPNCPLWGRWPGASVTNLYLQIAELAGKSCLIVNNTRYTLDQHRHPDIRCRHILLVRDGRAVVASQLRKDRGGSMWRAARGWARGMRKRLHGLRRQDPSCVTTVLYERLQADTETEVHGLCDFLQIPFEPAMLQYWTAPHHFIGGNRGSLLFVARAQGLDHLYRQSDDGTLEPMPITADQPVVAIQGGKRELDLSPYYQQQPGSFVDERWKRELSNWQLRLFALAAGRTNRRLGYRPTLDRSTGVGHAASV